LCQESMSEESLNIYHKSIAFFHTPSSCQAYLIFYEPDQEIHRSLRMSPSHNFMYAIEKN
jgi:hypothetical protein